jgi:hypothetical protein
MPSGLTYEEIHCKSCGRLFVPSQAGHEDCRHKCRWTGPKPEAEWEDWPSIERLWDPSCDENEFVRPDDWCHKCPSWRTDDDSRLWRRLHDHETVGLRRRHYRRLEAAGEL